MPPSPLPIGRYYPDQGDAQAPVDVAVVIPTLLRPDLAAALRSIYAQTIRTRVQVLIGVDVAQGRAEDFEPVFAERPDHVSILLAQPPYSTSTRHGGLHNAPFDGGATRAVLAWLANSRHVALLDDDNTYLPEHLETLRALVEGRVWAAGQRLLVDQETDEPITVDIWDSVGPDLGRFADEGGFVDPNCLMFDKLKAQAVLHLLAGVEGRGDWIDRRFFKALSHGSHAMIRRPTIRYRINRQNLLWKFILESRAAMGEPAPAA